MPDRPRPHAADRTSTAPAFRAVRKAHATELAEDYVEAIAGFIERQGQCRVKDLSERFGVTHVTVTRTVSRLVDQGLARTEPYRPITLTPAGLAMARAARRRHDIVLRFLDWLGVSPATAKADAEGIEHHISPETLEALESLLHTTPRPTSASPDRPDDEKLP